MKTNSIEKQMEVKSTKTDNFIVKVLEDKKEITDTLKKGGKLSSIPGIKIVSPL